MLSLEPPTQLCRAFHWGEAGESSNACADDYDGSEAANQPEIYQTQDLIRKDGRYKGYINFHSFVSNDQS